jgi:hypothetical protein
MKRRALIVGISDYAPLVPDLQSSVFEMERWRDLLVDIYHFADHDIRLLADRRATRSAILDRLIWLLSDTHADDELVFIFCGHGMRVRRRDSVGDLIDLQDEGIVAYPAGSADPLDAVIFDDDLTTLYCSMAVALKALPTFVFDCCYSAGLDFSEAERVRKSIMLPADLAHRNRSTANVVRFGLEITKSAVTHPLMIAASGEYDQAIEIVRDNQSRSLFSSLAIAALRTTPTLTYQELIATISPHMQFAGQEPCLIGDAERLQQQFLK